LVGRANKYAWSPPRCAELAGRTGPRPTHALLRLRPSRPLCRCRMKFQCCRLAMQTGISFSHADNSLVDRLCRTTRLAVAARPHAYQQRRISLPRRAGRRVPVRCPLRGSSDVRPGRRSTAPLNCISPALHASVTLRAPLTVHPCQREGDSVAEWLACRTQAQ